jgi:hypothetical protein
MDIFSLLFQLGIRLLLCVMVTVTTWACRILVNELLTMAHTNSKNSPLATVNNMSLEDVTKAVNVIATNRETAFLDDIHVSEPLSISLPPIARAFFGQYSAVRFRDEYAYIGRNSLKQLSRDRICIGYSEDCGTLFIHRDNDKVYCAYDDQHADDSTFFAPSVIHAIVLLCKEL